jgi:Glycosyl hydrolases family 31
MRAAVLILFLAAALRAGVVSRELRDGKLTIRMDDGAGEVEFISAVSFRFARSWGGEIEALPKIAHDRIVPTFTETGGALSLRTRYITLNLDPANLNWRVKSGDATVASGTVTKGLRVQLNQSDKVFGLMGGSTGRLNLRGDKLERDHGFFFTNAGYGIHLRAPQRAVFDLGTGAIDTAGAKSIEFTFYFGPTAKEIIEQHAMVTGATEVTGEALDLLTADRLPKVATRVQQEKVSSWDGLSALVRKLNQWSLSAVLYPAIDVSLFDGEVRGRAADLCTLLPIVYRGEGEGGIDAQTRRAWTPYLVTYLREAHDRGFPVIRPLPFQFSKDPNADRQADVFMLGDEVLIAPVLTTGSKRKLELPRGNWTDLRTNAEYRGNQAIEVDAPMGRVPMFVRNGWIVPLAAQGKMELHYFPSLGGEFFLWEPEVQENSQFHAAPAGDFMRVEIESQVRRTYEWVIHHAKAPREIAEDAATYQKVAERGSLRPGTWWHDDGLNNLHVMLRAEPGSDRIVNISF